MSCPVGSSPSGPVQGCPVSQRAADFDPFTGAYQENPAQFLKWAREDEPVFFSPKLGYWIVTRYQDVKAVFRDNLTFSPSIALEKITPPPPEAAEILQRYGYAMNRTMVNEDEPDHMERRRLLMDAFLPEALAQHEPMVRSLARQYMDRFIDHGRADLVKEMFHEIPLTVALHFLGVPDEGADQLRKFAVAHTLNTWGRPTPEQQIEVAVNVGRFWQTAQRILDGMRADPSGEGWMYDTIRQHLKHPEIVTESYLRSMMMAILAAAHETTSNATANAFMTLLQHRSAWEAICENPSLIPNAVEECLRLAGSIIAWRRLAMADTTVGGVSIPKGAKLLIVQASANADPEHFENPDEVDLYRENAVEHLTFGYGAHQCMGKNIGRMEMRVFLEEFTRRLPHLRLVKNQTFEFLPNTSFRGPAQLWVEWDPAANPERRDRHILDRQLSFHIGAPIRDDIVRPVVVKERHSEGDGLVRLILAEPRGRRFPVWSAGSHIDLVGGGFRRKYSLCGDPEDRETLQVTILREADGRGGSRYFCDEVQPGDTVHIAGPKNLFKLDETAPHYCLIAGGIGITPILAMADRLRRLGRSYVIHYAGRSRSAMGLLSRLERDHMHACELYVSDEDRRMDLKSILGALGVDVQVYACGPGRLIEALENIAAEWPEGRLRYEHFSSAGGALDPSKEHRFSVRLADSGIELTVAADQSLLETLQTAGIDIPCDCGEGLCGTCEVAVIDGDIDHRDKVLSKSERAENRRMMACCSRARGDKITLAL
jgi:cytochrome P450/ferredoxin-NADP reductase